MARRALSASRAAEVLDLVASRPSERFSCAELSRRLSVNPASMHSLLLALSECGYLSRDPGDRTYSLGAALVAIGDAALRANPIVDEARAQMRQLSRRLKMGALVFVRAGSDAMCASRSGGSKRRGDRTEVGQRVPIMAPLASVFVAWGTDEDVDQWLDRGGATGAERERQRELVSVVRERGYSVGQEGPDRRRVGALAEQLTGHPQSIRLQSELVDAIEELGRSRYQVAAGMQPLPVISTITAPVFAQPNTVVAALTIEVYDRPADARMITELGRELLDASQAVCSG